MMTKKKAIAPTTALKNTPQTKVYQNYDGESRPLRKKTSIFMAGLILLRLQAGLYSPIQKHSVWPVVEMLLQSYFGGAKDAT